MPQTIDRTKPPETPPIPAYKMPPVHETRLPPADEREQIVAFLEKETAKFNTLTAEAQSAIDLLQERRTALISAAVTGQIDVRSLVESETA